MGKPTSRRARRSKRLGYHGIYRLDGRVWNVATGSATNEAVRAVGVAIPVPEQVGATYPVGATLLLLSAEPGDDAIEAQTADLKPWAREPDDSESDKRRGWLLGCPIDRRQLAMALAGAPDVLTVFTADIADIHGRDDLPQAIVLASEDWRAVVAPMRLSADGEDEWADAPRFPAEGGDHA